MASILLIVDSTGYAGTGYINDALAALGHTTTTIAASSYTSYDFTTYDLVLTSRIEASKSYAPGVATGVQQALAAGTPCGISMTDIGQQDTDYATTMLTRIGLTNTSSHVSDGADTQTMIIDSATGPLYGFYTGSTTIYTGDCYNQAPVDIIGAVLATCSSEDSALAGRPMLSLIEAGTAYSGGTTNARCFCWSGLYAGQNAYSASGQTILGNLIDWLGQALYAGSAASGYRVQTRVLDHNTYRQQQDVAAPSNYAQRMAPAAPLGYRLKTSAVATAPYRTYTQGLDAALYRALARDQQPAIWRLMRTAHAEAAYQARAVDSADGAWRQLLADSDSTAWAVASSRRQGASTVLWRQSAASAAVTEYLLFAGAADRAAWQQLTDAAQAALYRAMTQAAASAAWPQAAQSADISAWRQSAPGESGARYQQRREGAGRADWPQASQTEQVAAYDQQHAAAGRAAYGAATQVADPGAWRLLARGEQTIAHRVLARGHDAADYAVIRGAALPIEPVIFAVVTRRQFVTPVPRRQFVTRINGDRHHACHA